MDIFEYSDYKEFVNAWVNFLPNKGRGKFREMAIFINSSPTIISQIFKGDRDLNLEQAAELCEYFQFSESECEYFLLLVSTQRAGSHKLQNILRKQIQKARKKSQKIENRLKNHSSLPEVARAQFYSQWYYSGVRNLIAIGEFKTPEMIADRLALPRPLVLEVLEFLLKSGLCKEENGKLEIATQKTHLSGDSLLASRHHINWRLKAFEKYNKMGAEEICYTSPMSLSVQAFEKIRKELLKLIENANAIMTNSPSEEVACLNIDWFKY